MIGTVRRTWPDVKRTTIIVTETATGKDFLCYVFLPEGQWIAALCEQAWENGHPERATPLVFTLDPKSQWGYKIVGCELLPETRNGSMYTDLEYTSHDDVMSEPQGSLSDVQMHMNRVHGKDWKDI